MWKRWSTSSKPASAAQSQPAEKGVSTSTVDASLKDNTTAPEPAAETSQASGANGVPAPQSTTGVPSATGTTSTGDAHSGRLPATVTSSDQGGKQAPATANNSPRGISFRALAFFYGGATKKDVIQAPERPSANATRLSRSEKSAHASALDLQTLMFGGPATLSGAPAANGGKRKGTKVQQPPDLKKLKSKLMNPKAANPIIVQLRGLAAPDGPTIAPSPSSDAVTTHPTGVSPGPIHAVCLDCTDAEAEVRHFSKLSSSPKLPASAPSSALESYKSVVSADLDTLASVLSSIHLVSFIAQPDFGFSQPVGGQHDGILSGAVPAANTVAQGFLEITEQLINLGFATSNTVLPSHAGVYPPTDRISMLTYWWGLEVLFPEPSVKYLSNVPSIAHTLINFLSAMAMVNNGVREALPFIRYISNFIDFEWNAIKAQDKGQGVVLAATWVMPAAMVPRPWDFTAPPAEEPSSTSPSTAPPIPSATPAAPGPPPTATNGTTVNQPAPSQPVNNMPYAPPMLGGMLPTLMVTPATLPRNAIAPSIGIS